MDSNIYPSYRDPSRLSDYEVLCSISTDAAISSGENNAMQKFQNVVHTLEWLRREISKQRDLCSTDLGDIYEHENHKLSIVKLERRIETANRQIKNLLRNTQLNTLAERERQHLDSERRANHLLKQRENVRESINHNTVESLPYNKSSKNDNVLNTVAFMVSPPRSNAVRAYTLCFRIIASDINDCRAKGNKRQ